MPVADSLQNLLEGIYSSVMEARRILHQQHLQLFTSYFDKKVIPDPDTGDLTEVYVPRLVAMATSRGVGENEVFEIVEAPAITLVPLSGLSIDTMEIEFETKLTDLTILDETDTVVAEASDEANDSVSNIISRTIDDLFGSSSEISIMHKGDGFESSTSPAKVKITFKMTDPPEAVSLMQEELLDYLRQN